MLCRQMALPSMLRGQAARRWCWFTDGFRVANPALTEQVRDWVIANREEIYAPIYQVLGDGVTELLAPKPPITVPTLVPTADRDGGNPPAMSRAISAGIPGATLVILEGLRHMALAEAPQIFNENLLTFLRVVKPHD